MMVDNARLSVDDLHNRIQNQAAHIADLKKEHADIVNSMQEMSQKLDDLYRALMEPQAGQEKSLLDRVGRITVAYESGGIISGMVVRVAGFVIAIGALVATIRAGMGGTP